ncbi:hypothetical protein PENTCL1PPCAC_21818, partial [Pristionchus entomophagus]
MADTVILGRRAVESTKGARWGVLSHPPVTVPSRSVADYGSREGVTVVGGPANQGTAMGRKEGREERRGLDG